MTAVDPSVPQTDPAIAIDHAAELAHLDTVAVWLDAKFPIPGTQWRFGLDSLIGWVPVLGDTLMLAPTGYMIHKACKLGLPRRAVARIVFNTTLDFTIGAIPIVGDVFDFWFKNNLRSVAIVRSYLDAASAAEQRTKRLSGL